MGLPQEPAAGRSRARVCRHLRQWAAVPIAVREQITIDVVTVDVTDEYRVELRQEKKRANYSTQQARDLVFELMEVTDKVDQAIADGMEARGLRFAGAAIIGADGTVIL